MELLEKVIANCKAVEAIIGRPVTNSEYSSIARMVGSIHRPKGGR